MEFETQLAALVVEMDQLKDDHSNWFTRLNGRLPSTSNARKARKDIKELRVKAKDIEQQVKITEKDLDKVTEEIEKIRTEIDKVKGPFVRDIEHLLASLKLEQHVYHHGALVGNDVQKLMEPTNIVKMSAIFRPCTIDVHDGRSKTFGSHAL